MPPVCRNGPSCPFLANGCRFYHEPATRLCRNGDACPFRHTKAGCRYIHQEPEESEEPEEHEEPEESEEPEIRACPFGLDCRYILSTQGCRNFHPEEHLEFLLDTEEIWDALLEESRLNADTFYPEFEGDSEEEPDEIFGIEDEDDEWVLFNDVGAI